jgi:ribosomal protein S18 acetylase RimI-like enzyme
MSEQNGGRADSVTLRPLVPADWAQLRETRLAALAEAPYAFSSTLEQEQEFGEALWRSRAGSGRTLGAWDGDAIVGLATGIPAESGPDWHLVGMWVSPSWRGTSVAERLVLAVCEQARRAGAESVTLWVTEVNHRARAFYRRLGFAPTGSRQLVRQEEPDAFEEELTLRLTMWRS